MENDLANQRVFSFSVGDGDEISKVTFGGYDLENYGRGDIYWHSLLNEDFWSLSISGAALGDTLLPVSVDSVIIDTGTSFLLTPLEDFQAIAGIFSDAFTCGVSEEFNDLFTCICSDEEYEMYPTLQI